MSWFDDIIQQKANDHEAHVPDDIWNNIQRKKGKRRVGFFWWAAAILFIGLLMLGYYNFKTTGIEKYAEVSKAHKVTANDEAVKMNRPDAMTKIHKTNKADKIDKIDGQVWNIHKTKTDSHPVFIINATDEKRTEVLDLNNKNITEQHKKKNIVAEKNRMIKKENERLGMKTENADTEEFTGKELTTIPVTVTMESATSNTKADLVIDDKKETLRDKTTKEPVHPPVFKKDLPIDSTQKTLIVTAAEESKKQPAAKKIAGKHSWFIDAAATPVLPIQQYDNTNSFNRTLFLSDGKSEFSGKITSTKIKPSFAFSLGAKRSVNQQLSIGFGLQYLQLKEHISIEGKQVNTVYKYGDWIMNYINGPERIIDTVSITMEGKRNIDAANIYRFLSVPVYLEYNLLQKHSWSLGIVAGIKVNILNSYRNEINRNTKAPLINTSQKNGKTDIGLSLFTGLRIEKMLNKRFRLYSMPSFSYSPYRQHIRNNVTDKKIHQAGISLGISYKLK